MNQDPKKVNVNKMRLFATDVFHIFDVEVVFFRDKTNGVIPSHTQKYALQQIPNTVQQNNLEIAVTF